LIHNALTTFWITCIGISVALHGLIISSSDVYTVLDDALRKKEAPSVELLAPTFWQKESVLSAANALSSGVLEGGVTVQEEGKTVTAPSAVASLKPETSWREARDAELRKFKTEAEMSLFVSYYRILSLLIQRQIDYPKAALKKGIGGSVYLVFQIDEEGNLLDVSVKKSSGEKVLDRVAIRAVKRAAPFPRLPRDLEAKVLNFYLPIFFKKRMG